MHHPAEQGSILIVKCNGTTFRIPLEDSEGFSIEIEAPNENQTTRGGISLEKTDEMEICQERTLPPKVGVYHEQISRLQSAGYNNKEVNLELLRKYGGDFNRVIQHIEKNNSKLERKLSAKEEKYTKKANKKKEKLGKPGFEESTRSVDVLDSLPPGSVYREQMSALLESGFVDQEKNLKYLEKYSGDMEKVLVRLERKEMKKCAKVEKYDAKLEKKREKVAKKMEKKKL
mmetsp:Transcript_128257/g.191145  ORF Transcript_128257/g.191145 Transcript_128257/m.191145 type:complete len:230 (+) Transcript_128257:3-692(+)